MSVPWININSNLQMGISLMNLISRTKFNLLLQRIVDTSNSQDQNQIFTADELTKLSESLKLHDMDKVQLLVGSMTHVFKQASKVILKPTVLQEQLVGILQLSPDKAEDFTKVWTLKTNKDFDLGGCRKLENICWEVDLQSASSFSGQGKVPHARLQMDLSGSQSKENKCDVILDLRPDEVLHLYNVLETVQVKLDSLNK